jgi:fatty-acid desaturase
MNKYTPLLTTWLFYLFLAISPIWIYMSEWSHLLWFYLAYWFVADVVHSLFLHRWAAHKTWNPPRLLQYVMSIIGTIMLLGTPLTWAAWHRTHHKTSDTEADPHSPKFKGWLYCIFRHRYHYANFKMATDRMRDKYLVFITKYEFYIVLLSHIVLLYVLGPQWYLTLIAMPGAFTILFANLFIIVVPHLNDKISNMPWAWPFVFSEAWHKDHHDKPKLICSPVEITGRIVKALKWN